MAYSELIKSFERIRNYMREFYVYGFKSREEYSIKSARSYDNERRRIESWIGDFMSFHQDTSGKNVFLSVDSRRIPHNPLHKAKSLAEPQLHGLSAPCRRCFSPTLPEVSPICIYCPAGAICTEK